MHEIFVLEKREKYINSALWKEYLNEEERKIFIKGIYINARNICFTEHNRFLSIQKDRKERNNVQIQKRKL